jgi:hypothetical protein
LLKGNADGSIWRIVKDKANVRKLHPLVGNALDPSVEAWVAAEEADVQHALV